MTIKDKENENLKSNQRSTLIVMINKVTKILTGDDILYQTDKWDTHWIKEFDWIDNTWINNILDDHFYVNVSELNIKGSVLLNKVNIN